MSKQRKIICIDCGEYRITKSHDLSEKKCKPCYTKSQRLKPNQDSTYKILVANIKSGAKKRGYCYELSFDEFREIVSMHCYWCGIKPPLKNPKGERMPTLPAPAHGIDRLDNSLGYIYNNCVPSCQTCNVAKNNYSADEFRAWIQRVYTNQFQEVISA